MVSELKKLQEVKVLVAAVLALAVVYYLIGALIFAIVVAYIARPLFNFLESKIKQRNISAGLTTLIALGVAVYPVILGLRSLTANVSEIAVLVSGGINNLFGLFEYLGITLTSSIYELFAHKLLEGLSGVLFATPQLLLKFFILIAMIFYFLRDGDKIKAYVKRLARNKHQERILKSMEELLEAIILGYFTMAVLMGAIAAVGFWLLGYSNPMLFAVVVGMAALLPIIGPWIIYIPLAVYEYLQGDYRMVGIVIAFGLFLQMLEMYVAPKIASMKTRVHPGIMLLGFIGGPLFFGLKGLILGPIILGTFKVILDHYE